MVKCLHECRPYNFLLSNREPIDKMFTQWDRVHNARQPWLCSGEILEKIIMAKHPDKTAQVRAFDHMYLTQTATSVIGCKQPNYPHMGVIGYLRAMDPETPLIIVYCQRDGRDAVASWYKELQKEEPQSWGMHPSEGAPRWVAHNKSWEQERQSFEQMGCNTITWRMDNMIESDASCEQLAFMCGLPADELKLNWQRLVNPEAAHWRRFKTDLPNWRDYFGPEGIKLLNQLGY